MPPAVRGSCLCLADPYIRQPRWTYSIMLMHCRMHYTQVCALSIAVYSAKATIVYVCSGRIEARLRLRRLRLGAGCCSQPVMALHAISP